MSKFAPWLSIQATPWVAIKVCLTVLSVLQACGRGHSPLTRNHRPSIDRQSNCTSFDGLDCVQSPDHVAHCYTNTSMDRSSKVFNGDIARAYDSSSKREHHLHGGSVKNKSTLVNGDLDRDTFLAVFCGAEPETRQGRSRPEDPRHRRQGPRQGPRTANRANPQAQD